MDPANWLGDVGYDERKRLAQDAAVHVVADG